MININININMINIIVKKEKERHFLNVQWLGYESCTCNATTHHLYIELPSLN